MKYILIVFALLTISSKGFSQRYDNELKFGVMTFDGKIVTKAIYDDIDMCGANHGESHVVASINGKKGVVGPDGRQIGAIKYDKVSIFSRPMFEVYLNRKVGFMNREGKEVIPCVYDDYYTTDRLNGWYEMRRDGKYVVVDSLNNVVFPFDEDNFISYENNEYTYNVALRKDGLWALASRKGELLTPFKYEKIELFHKGGGRALVGSEYYLLSPSGKEIDHTTLDFKGIEDMRGLIAVCDKSYNVRLYSYKGEKLNAEYKGELSIVGFSDGLASIKTQNGWIVIDTLGNRLFDKYYYPPVGREFNGIVFGGGLAVVQNQNGMHGVINKKGDVVIPFQYPNLDRLLFFYNNYFIVKDENFNIRILNINNKFITSEAYYDAFYFEDAGIMIKKDGKQGLISTKGTEILPCIYDEITNCRNGLVVTKAEDKIGFYNVRSGKKIEPAFDDWLFSHSGDSWIVEQDGKRGVINTNCDIVLPCEYLDIELIPDGYIIATNHEKKSAIMDAKGKILRPFGKERLYYFRDDLLIFSVAV